MPKGGEVLPWPKDGGALSRAPERIYVAADHGLRTAIWNLETQLGSIEAYNRLVESAMRLRAKIEAGEGKAANPIYVKNPEIRRAPYPI